MKRLTAPILALVGLSLISWSAVGQDLPIVAGTEPGVQPGAVFEPYNTWNQIRLGATGLIHPDVVRASPILYSYDVKVLLNASQTWSDFVLAKKSSQNDFYVALDSAQSAKLLDLVKTTGSVDSLPPDLKVLTFEKMFASEKPEQLISWAK